MAPLRGPLALVQAGWLVVLLAALAGLALLGLLALARYFDDVGALESWLQPKRNPTLRLCLQLAPVLAALAVLGGLLLDLGVAVGDPGGSVERIVLGVVL